MVGRPKMLAFYIMNDDDSNQAGSEMFEVVHFGLELDGISERKLSEEKYITYCFAERERFIFSPSDSIKLRYP